MSSANIVYQHISKKYMDNILNPFLTKKSYFITNFQSIGDASCPKSLILSIRSDNVGSEKPSAVLKKLEEDGKKLIDRYNQKVHNNSERLFEVYLNQDYYTILGEYSASETAEQLFPSLALEYVLNNAEEKLDDFKKRMRSFGESFTKI